MPSPSVLEALRVSEAGQVSLACPNHRPEQQGDIKADQATKIGPKLCSRWVVSMVFSIFPKQNFQTHSPCGICKKTPPTNQCQPSCFFFPAKTPKRCPVDLPCRFHSKRGGIAQFLPVAVCVSRSKTSRSMAAFGGVDWLGEVGNSWLMGQ